VKKAFWRSKTFWASAIAVLIGAYETVIVPNFGTPPIPPLVYSILGIFGLYGRATATQPLGLGDDDVQSSA
jgi:hypothetical protein